MTDSDNHNEQYPDINGVNDPVIAHPESVAGPSSKRPRRWRTRILSEQRNGALNTRLRGTINLSNFAQGRGPELNSIFVHDQPRSIFTCSQGMLAPSSANAASYAASSCDSSKASSISS